MAIFKTKPTSIRETRATPRRGILLVDDEPDILDAIAESLSDRYRVETATCGEEGLDLLARLGASEIQAIIADQRMPGMSGVEFLDRARCLYPEVGRIVLTGYTDFQAAVQSINQCKASAFLLKPFDRGDLLNTIEKVLHEADLRNQAVRNLTLKGIAGSRMRAFLQSHATITDSDATVLIQGETGTGKELVARALHDNSHRAGKPFVAIHCAALPETLFEAELFGHRQGAFTGAHRDRKGRVNQARGGTLFIDEVGEIPPSVQGKLLRFFQSGEYQRVGCDMVGHADVRIVAATHRNLREMVEEGSFRQDLYYRLNVLVLSVPALRERLGDLQELVEMFLMKYSKGAKTLSRQALMVLHGYDYPGNVRQLEHCIQRACALCQIGEIGPHHLSPEILEHFGRHQPLDDGAYRFEELTNAELKAARALVSKHAVEKLERTFLKQLMARFDSIVAAARHAGMARAYLHRLLTKHQLRPPKPSSERSTEQARASSRSINPTK
ncbi:Sigma-54-dependent Fis family transcriptional regulator [Sulfidibacter corallicola]|uniref:Sigma-54-dependent Fis family transcriptional regulator n=1 Tax=Sulfidibacter corallicola TaxID=2818388 RepID=A0A8A4TTR4_SULCO|nr:sigma-54 dependent transcriptional regulator [Sulfidibacter corallicola]QTD52498.1 sigma-54-dependent Fis family transcriptional regulator [Sulfidibacter corallicola]